MAHITYTLAPGQDFDQATRVEHRATPKLDFLQAQVGGYIETVPHLTRVVIDGRKVRCTAYCDEEGLLKNNPVNHAATQAWLDALGDGPFSYEPQLRGSVVFVINANQLKEVA